MKWENLKEIYRSGKPLKYMEEKTWEAINELVEIKDELVVKNFELENKLNFALDCLDECHGMEMYWEEYPEEDNDEK